MKNSFRHQVVILILFVFITSCENDIRNVNSDTSENNKALPNESSKNVKFLYSDSAHIRSMLTAPQLDRFIGKANYFEFPKGMKMSFYNNKYPKEQSKLTADFAIGYDNGNKIERMEAKRNVVMINEKGDKPLTAKTL